MEEKICPYCEKTFVPHNYHQAYCTRKCQSAFNKRKWARGKGRDSRKVSSEKYAKSPETRGSIMPNSDPSKLSPGPYLPGHYKYVSDQCSENSPQANKEKVLLRDFNGEPLAFFYGPNAEQNRTFVLFAMDGVFTASKKIKMEPLRLVAMLRDGELLFGAIKIVNEALGKIGKAFEAIKGSSSMGEKGEKLSEEQTKAILEEAGLIPPNQTEDPSDTSE